MINKRNLPIVLLILGAGVFVAFRTLGIGGNPPTKYEKILHNVGSMLEEIHYSPKQIDDKFSKEVFGKYLADVDVEKNVLMQTDIDSLADNMRRRSMTRSWARPHPVRSGGQRDL